MYRSFRLRSILALTDNRTGETGQLGRRKTVIELQLGVAALLDQLEARAVAVGAGMADAILREVEPMKAVSRNDPSFRQRFARFCEQHVRTFIQTTRAGRIAGPEDLNFVRLVAVRRADDAFPLPELMEGLRIGHRVLSRSINQIGSGWDTPAASVLWLTSRLIDYMDAAGAVLADSYRTRQRLSAGRTQLMRRELLDDMLEGRYSSRPDAAFVASSLGFEPDGHYCVVVLIATGEDGRRTQALAAEVSTAIFASTGLRFVVVRGDEVVGVFRDVEAYSAVAEAAAAYDRKWDRSQARAGLSTACRGIGEVARGYWEAVRALRFTTDMEHCVDLQRMGPLRYLEFSADSVARRLATQQVGPLAKAPHAKALTDTILSYVECGLNVRLTAERMGVHLNTVHNRLERVAEVLDRPELRPVDLVELASAIRICRSAP
jgi:hypothetical protein